MSCWAPVRSGPPSLRRQKKRSFNTVVSRSGLLRCLNPHHPLLSQWKPPDKQRNEMDDVGMEVRSPLKSRRRHQTVNNCCCCPGEAASADRPKHNVNGASHYQLTLEIPSLESIYITFNIQRSRRRVGGVMSLSGSCFCQSAQIKYLNGTIICAAALL